MSPLDTPVALAGIAAMLAATLGILAWGLARASARGDTYPAPQPGEYEATAHRWNPPQQRTQREDFPFDQEAAAAVAALEDWVNEPGQQDGAA